MKFKPTITKACGAVPIQWPRIAAMRTINHRDSNNKNKVKQWKITRDWEVQSVQQLCIKCVCQTKTRTRTEIEKFQLFLKNICT